MIRWPFTPKAPPQIAALRQADAPSAARIHAEAFARPWDAHDLERMIADPAILGDAVFHKHAKTLSGFVLSRKVLDEAEILTIAVARATQGRGLARALLTAHLGRLAAAGVATLYLEVEEGNSPAIGLYRAFGFEETGRREAYYTKPDGRRAAALTMRRVLDDGHGID